MLGWSFKTYHLKKLMSTKIDGFKFIGHSVQDEVYFFFRMASAQFLLPAKLAKLI